MTDQLVSVGVAAEKLGVSDDTIRRWADAGLLAAIVLPSGHRRFRVADLDVFLTRHRSDEASA